MDHGYFPIQLFTKYFLDLQNEYFEAFEEEDFLFMIMRRELRSIHPEAVEAGPVADGDEEHNRYPIVHYYGSIGKL